MVKVNNNIILGTGNYDNVKSLNTVSITGDGGNNWWGSEEVEFLETSC